MNPSEESNPYFAAIDLGSNSFHLLVVKLNDSGAFEKIDRVKDMVQIARGLSATNELSEASQERALHCLRCFQERIREIPATQIRVAGTKALRSANNASAFLKKAEAALGHKIDIISGYEEARLVYLGVSHDISPDKGRHLVIDIGGGSTEFIIGENQQAKLLESLSIGCVTYSDRFFSDKKGIAPTQITTEMIWKTYYATCIELESISKLYLHTGWQFVVGSSGTMRAIAQLIQEDVVAGVITRTGLSVLLNHLHQHGTLIETSDLTAERRNVLPAGIIILSAIFDQFNLNEIHVVDSALKEGLIFDTIGRFLNNGNNNDVRDTTVNKMMEKYQVDSNQADLVDHTLSHFAQKLPIPVVNGINVKKILHWAAKLHEIGLTISHSGHHHHGHYLIQASDMAGFSRSEQELLALLIGSHRRKIRSERLALLTAENQQTLYPLLICLRLSALLNHRREAHIELPEIDFIFTDTQDNTTTHQHLIINLRFPENWLDEHPLTKHKLSQEQHHLSPLGVTLNYS
jgi:exopolyphosphatase / guanosine-5'-triphosphate,3'-diphosphate pyrophosphatase